MGFVRTVIWAVVIGVFSYLVSLFLRGPSAPLLLGGYVEPGFEAVEHAFR